MLDRQGFDLWSEGYDKDVGVCDENNCYPFAGYQRVLNTIYSEVLKKSCASVLDIGFGTGTLTTKLYEKGFSITGIDFSVEMIQHAKKKMPNAALFCSDFTKGLPAEVEKQIFDFIIATYSLHHLTDAEKITFISILEQMLNLGGKILIGDVAFENRSLLEECKTRYADEWDKDEFYFVYDELASQIKGKIDFQKISFCSGICSITKA